MWGEDAWGSVAWGDSSVVTGGGGSPVSPAYYYALMMNGFAFVIAFIHPVSEFLKGHLR